LLGGDKSATYEDHRTGARANLTLPQDQNRINSFLIGLRAENAELRQQSDKKTVGTLPVDATGTIAALSLGFLRDNRDLRLDPSRGLFFQAIVERTLPGLSSNFDFTRVRSTIDPGTGLPVLSQVRTSRPTSFTKLEIDMRNYFPLIRGTKPEDPAKLVFTNRLVVGRAFGELPPFEQYFIGGSDTVRGFEDEVQFGDNQFFTNTELRYRFNRQFQFVGFFDAGSARGGLFQSADTGLLFSAGIGLRVRTPIGPIRLDFARPLSGAKDGGFKTHFGIGSTF
jgi:outer membrane protein insertion porin family